MNLKESLLILLIPLAILPVFLCFILFSLFPGHTIAFVFISVVIICVAILLSYGVINFFLSFIDEIKQSVSIIASGDFQTQIRTSSSIRDFVMLKECIENMRLKLVQTRYLEIQRDKLKAIKYYISAQVAHDIRSPLAALSAVTQGLSDLPEEKRIMIRSAVQRINDIANDLAFRGDAKNEVDAGKEQLSVQLLSSLVDSLISEKRMQYRSRLGVNIESNLNNLSYGLFAKIQAVPLKRVVSNLVNNAVEAMKDDGRVTIGLGTNKNDEIEITVTDTGCGIPADKLSSIMQKGVSFKKGGQGLGLFHASESVVLWGGRIDVKSTVAGTGDVPGTTFTITLPRQSEPDWFVSDITAYEGTRVVILDDDESIHQIWKGRFEAFKVGVELHHFSNGNDLGRWLSQDGKTCTGPTLFLCDYEILGSDESGLDVIKKLNLAEKSILVTSRYEEIHVRKECEILGIKLLPKNLAGFVPIMYKAIPDDLEFVLIDDNRMNRATWEVMARKNKKQLITFEKPHDFYDIMEKINKDVKLYVDVNLGHGERGEDVSKKISEKGFTRIYLATGESDIDLTGKPWIAGVVGKEAPFRGN